MIEDLTLWEIVAYIDGYNQANEDPNKQEAMSDQDFEDLLAMHNVSTD